LKKILLSFLILIIVYSCNEEVSLSFTEFNLEYSENSIIEINAPRVDGESAIGDLINVTIENHISNTLNFSDDQTNLILADALEKFDTEYKTFKNDFEENALVWEATFDGEVTYQSSEIISIALTSYLNTGGAHGNMNVTFLNFNPSTGELLKIDDLIANKLAFTNLSQQHFNAAIQTSDGINFEDYFFGEGFQLPENIGFNNDGVNLFYNVYEIAAYAMGITEFTIPYNESAALLNVN